ncbi:hypothetical protein EVAR_71185_1 [Eumeta japonica]|uniref:Uncharacterized protein n=1 Tax=Eumeta variegata TaxID=151549 RepID=A0A4C2AEC6_EUMVA|nr:hypothetical protein EVAR_71185_1 [Eumeta japonica]
MYKIYCVGAILWPTWLQHRNVLGQPIKCHTITEYGRDEIQRKRKLFRSAQYLIPSQKTDNALRTPLELRVFMDGGDHLLIDGSHIMVLPFPDFDRTEHSKAKHKAVCIYGINRGPPFIRENPSARLPIPHLYRGVRAARDADESGRLAKGARHLRPSRSNRNFMSDHIRLIFRGSVRTRFAARARPRTCPACECVRPYVTRAAARLSYGGGRARRTCRPPDKPRD